jgi:DNA-directed RNA polymerase subunit RPC12/RpoP
MGTIVKYHCSNCSKIKGEAFLGFGMSFPTNHTVNRLYGCDACGKVFEGGEQFPPSLAVLTGEELANPCPKCGKESYALEREEDEPTGAGEQEQTGPKCPNCKTGTILFEDIGCWD